MSARRRTTLKLIATQSPASRFAEAVMCGLPGSVMRFYMRAPRSEARARWEQLAYSRELPRP